MKTLTDKKHFSDTNQSVDEWVNTLENRFKDFEFNNRVSEISTILSVEKKVELKRLEQASLIVYGKSLGVLSFEDACKKLGKSIDISGFDFIDVSYRKRQLALYKLTIIAEALNEGWIPNWNDSNEKKYYPRFDMSGTFSFYGTNYVWDNTHADGGSCLCLKNKDLAEFIGRYFIKLYKDFLN